MKRSVFEKLAKIIDVEGSISFDSYMNFALYDPEFGYYTNNINAINSRGDFITAPEISHLFGFSLANQCAQVLSKIENPQILEFGAGSAKLCVDIITRLEQLNIKLKNYYIVEVSGKLRHNQQQYIKENLPDFYSNVVWLDSLNDVAISGVIIANEVLDAMPVKRFLKKDNEVYESFIKYKYKEGTKPIGSQIDSQNSSFKKDEHELKENKYELQEPEYELIEEFKLAKDKKLLALVNEKVANNPLGYTSEVNLLLSPWLEQCYKALKNGVVFIIDYGFADTEYYHQDRTMGTLMCHYQHKSHTNPLIKVGLQDITAHVDFTEVANSAYDAGFNISGYTNQASFLLSNDLLGLLNNIEDEKELFTAKQAIKKLTHPYEMGELFKVIALTKNFTTPLAGFKLIDKRSSL